MFKCLKRNFKVRKIEKILGERPQNNGQQRNHTREDVEMCFKIFTELAKHEIFPYYYDYFETATMDDCQHILRLLSDNNSNYRIVDLAFRFCCISPETYIEYRIPYYVKIERNRID